MAKGAQSKRSEWDTQVALLQEMGSRWRMVKRSRSPAIQIREVQEGSVVSQFSSGGFLHDDDDHVRACSLLCQKSHEQGRWCGAAAEGAGPEMTWQEFAEDFEARYKANVPRASSHADGVSYMRKTAAWSGAISLSRLAKWMKETDPFRNYKKHEKQLQFLRDIEKYGYLETDKLIQDEKKRRPTRQQLKRLSGKDKPRAIPTDQELFDWLKSIESPLHQWAFAMIATYGLRPSELWHVKKMHDDGLIIVPAYPLCKTNMHDVRPVPSDWVEEFGLKKNFEAFREELLARYVIQWDENSQPGAVPLNNSRLADACFAQSMSRGYNGVTPLIARTWDSGPEGTTEREACAPYDFRHAYAIRLWTHAETSFLPLEKHAWLMGHSVQQHKDVYLKWMPEDRMIEAQRIAYDSAAKSAGTETPANSDELIALMAKVEQLERVNNKQRKMIDALQDDESAA